MKITGIEIGEYRQFKNIKFDFTYPADHERAGEPLDKICFIGQSGTGKTTLLNILSKSFQIFYFLLDHPNDNLNERFPSSGVNSIENGVKTRIDNQIEIYTKGIEFIADWMYYSYDNSKKESLDMEHSFWKHVNSTYKYCIYIKDTAAREADAFLIDQPGQDSVFGGLIKTELQVEKDQTKQQEIIDAAGKEKVTSFGDGTSLAVWRYLLKDIYEYDEEGRTLVTDFIQSNSQVSPDALIEQLNKWKINTPNPRLDLAQNCLNSILEKMHVEVDTSSGKVPIILKTKGGVKIDSSYISTGIRQILATAIPIYKFDTDGTVILFDEPERSLFPDVQRELVDYYTSLAPTAQFFFATHSPIIAASFEPCERFILYFNENGEVDFHRGVAPEGDDPNDVLRKDFGMSPLMNEEGIRQYEHYRNLAVRIRSETDESEKNRLIAERVELGNRYNFAGQHAPNQ